jgi:hypothetical protein
MKSLWIVLGTLGLLFAFYSQAEPSKCAVCGMEVSAKSRTSYSAAKAGTPVKLCSFVCAHSFHEKFPAAKLSATDFLTGKSIPADAAYYMVKSKTLAARKDLEFEMPPPIVAFGNETEAKKFQSELKDGEILKGFPAVEKKYE